MHLPPVPKWDKAVDGLDLVDFLRRAQDFERGLLPKDIVLPREGQVWESTRDCRVGFIAWFTSTVTPQSFELSSPPPPFFPCGSASLPEGERVRILALDHCQPLSVHFVPLRYAELEHSLVPLTIRIRPGYSNYQLSAPTACTVGLEKGVDYFAECFRLVEEGTS